jgi:hypothetical protein
MIIIIMIIIIMIIIIMIIIIMIIIIIIYQQRLRYQGRVCITFSVFVSSTTVILAEHFSTLG